MPKTYFHNYKFKDENNNYNKKRFIELHNKEEKTPVDINILLNRVKMEEKNQTKKKIVFFSLTTLALSLFLILVTIIK
tara:strand:+ start:34 stop:267 length:234 start_codon:yes stop_codon:yes gene_type:complete